jgi:hemolysin III
MQRHIAPRNTALEEAFNVFTHAIGFGLSIALLVILIVQASHYGSVWHIVSLSIYGSTLVLLYLASVLYHSFSLTRLRHIFNRLDRSAIYFLIAGTYTPFLLVTLRGEWGWSIFGVVWGIALLGTIFVLLSPQRFSWITTTSYLAMGWLIVIACVPVMTHIPLQGILLLVSGGIAYSVGVIFFAAHKLKFHHTIWHLFVLAGSTCHVLAVFVTVMPR